MAITKGKTLGTFAALAAADLYATAKAPRGPARAAKPFLMPALAAHARRTAQPGRPPAALLAGLACATAGDTALLWDATSRALADRYGRLPRHPGQLHGGDDGAARCRTGASHPPEARPPPRSPRWGAVNAVLAPCWSAGCACPVAGYSLALAAMGAAALGVGGKVAAGALAFIASDALIGLQAAGHGFPSQEVLIMAGYLLGQYLITTGWLERSTVPRSRPERDPRSAHTVVDVHDPNDTNSAPAYAAAHAAALRLGVRGRPLSRVRLAARARARTEDAAAQRGGGVAGDAVRRRAAGARRPAAEQEPAPSQRTGRTRQGQGRHSGRAQREPDDASAQHRPARPHPAAPAGLQGVHPAPGGRLRAPRTGVGGRLIDAFAARGEADLIHEYAFPLPIYAICDMLGVPREDQEDFRDWAGMMLHQPGSPRGGVGRAVKRMRGYLAELIHRKRAELAVRNRPGEGAS